jgi:hypothetical protein
MQCMIPINQSSRRHNPQPKMTTPMSPVLHHLSSHRYSVTEIHGVSVYPQTHSATATAHRDWVAIRPRFRGTIAGIFPSPGRASPPDPAAAPSRGLSAAVRPRTQWKLTRDLHGDHGRIRSGGGVDRRTFVCDAIAEKFFTVTLHCASVLCVSGRLLCPLGGDEVAVQQWGTNETIACAESTDLDLK